MAGAGDLAPAEGAGAMHEVAQNGAVARSVCDVPNQRFGQNNYPVT